MSAINQSQLLDQLNWRYATKQFDPNRKINASDWNALEQALLLSPSSGGLQPWKFIVVTDPAGPGQIVCPPPMARLKVVESLRTWSYSPRKINFSEGPMWTHTSSTRLKSAVSPIESLGAVSRPCSSAARSRIRPCSDFCR